MQSNREERTACVVQCRQHIGQALSETWQKGDHSAVKTILDHALDAPMRNQWKDDILAALPPECHHDFLEYMRAS